MMLPALEQSNVFNAINFTTGFASPATPQNTTIFNTEAQQSCSALPISIG